MRRKGFIRVLVGVIAGAVSFSFFPVGVLSYWIFLAQDNPVSDDDVLSLTRAVSAFGGTGALIGFISATTRIGLLSSMVLGLLMSLALVIATVISYEPEFSENPVFGFFMLFVLPGMFAGLISSGLCRRFE